MSSETCIHLLGLTIEEYEGYEIVEDHPPGRKLWTDKIGEKFEYCPRCGVKLEHNKNGTYTVKSKD